MKIKEYKKKLNSRFSEEKIPNVLESVKNSGVFNNIEYETTKKEKTIFSISLISKFAVVAIVCIAAVIVGMSGLLSNKSSNDIANNGGINNDEAMNDAPNASNPENPSAGEESGGSFEDAESEKPQEGLGISPDELENLKIFIQSNNPTFDETIIFAFSNDINISTEILKDYYNSFKNDNGKPNE